MFVYRVIIISGNLFLNYLNNSTNDERKKNNFGQMYSSQKIVYFTIIIFLSRFSRYEYQIQLFNWKSIFFA